MKKLFVIFLVSLFLFSCSISQLTDAMGKMGQNVMGDYVNEEAVDKAKDAATNVKTEETKTDNSGKTELSTITDKDGNSIKVDLKGKEVKKILPVLSDDVKNSIIDATSSDGGAKNLAETLNNTPIENEDTKSAAKGTATVLSTVLSSMTESGSLSGTDSEAKAAIENLTNNLDKLADKDSAVSAADVIALQAVTALVNQLASSATINNDGTINGVDISTDDNTGIISSALDTVTVIQAVNPASIITSDDFETLIKSLTKSESSRDMHSVETKYADAIRNFYTIYKNLFGDTGINKSKVSVMSLYSGATDLYVGLNGVDNLSGKVADIDRIIQYTLSSVFSKAEYIYSEKASEVFEGDEYPKTLSALIDLVVKKNPWIKDSTIEKTEFNDDFGLKYQPNKDYKSLVNDILKEMVSTGNTIKTLCQTVKLDSFGDDIKDKINKIPDFFNTGLDYDWK